jgi:hypothetical protein
MSRTCHVYLGQVRQYEIIVPQCADLTNMVALTQSGV